MMNPTRRRFVSLCSATIAVAAGFSGCGQEAEKQDGVSLDNPQNIQDDLNRSVVDPSR